jgi:hypothetical protein
VAEGRAFIEMVLRPGVGTGPGDAGGKGEKGPGDDDDVLCVAVSKPLSLHCVLTAARLIQPARGKLCRHLEVSTTTMDQYMGYFAMMRIGGVDV